MLLKHILLSDYIGIKTDYDRLCCCVLEKGEVVDISVFHDFVYVRNQGYWPVGINKCFVIFFVNNIF